MTRSAIEPCPFVERALPHTNLRAPAATPTPEPVERPRQLRDDDQERPASPGTPSATRRTTTASAADKARAVASEIEAAGGRVAVIHADHADPVAPRAAVEQTVRELGRLDVLVNNAGIFAGGPLEEAAVDEVDLILAVDVRAVFLASQAAAAHMTSGGRIINIGSALAERVPGPGLTLYSMSKSALVGLTKGLARDLASKGITATLVQPGAIDTDMNPQDGPAGDFLRSVTALGHYGRVEDIAAAVAYLADGGGRYVNGAALTVDGGLAA